MSLMRWSITSTSSVRSASSDAFILPASRLVTAIFADSSTPGFA